MTKSAEQLVEEFNMKQQLEIARARLDFARTKRKAADANAKFWSNEINIIKFNARNRGLDI